MRDLDLMLHMENLDRSIPAAPANRAVPSPQRPAAAAATAPAVDRPRRSGHRTPPGLRAPFMNPSPIVIR